jgi:hypothetical protein
MALAKSGVVTFCNIPLDMDELIEGINAQEYGFETSPKTT